MSGRGPAGGACLSPQGWFIQQSLASFTSRFDTRFEHECGSIRSGDSPLVTLIFVALRR